MLRALPIVWVGSRSSYLACDSGLGGARGVRNIRRMETKRDAEKQSVMPAIEGLTPE